MMMIAILNSKYYFRNILGFGLWYWYTYQNI